MSNWTHVAGIIRIDAIRCMEEEVDFDALIGKESDWDVPRSVWVNPKEYMPMGSEGSLNKHIWINSDKSCMAAYTVSIFGDLRDHDDPQEIIDWFKSICNKCWVRNATIVVENERNGTLSWTWEDGDNDENN